MTTRGALKTLMLSDMERDDAMWGTDVVQAINDAIGFYQRKRFYFNESAGVTFNTVAAQQSYSFNTPTSTGDIGAEFYRIERAYVTTGGHRAALDQEFYNSILEATDGTSPSGSPTDYAYVGRQLLLYPIPDAIYPITLTGHLKVAAPATDDETDNPWMTEAFELIRARGKANFAMNVTQDVTLAQLMIEVEKNAYSGLMLASMDRQRTGYVTPIEF